MASILNITYAILDIKGLIPWLTYNFKYFSYSETSNFYYVISICFSPILSIILSFYTLTKFLIKHENDKISDEIINTFKCLLFNWKFLGIYNIFIIFLWLIPDWKILDLLHIYYKQYFVIMILLCIISIPFIANYLFKNFIEKDKTYNISYKLKFFIISFLCIIGSDFILEYSNPKIMGYLANKLSPNIIQSRLLGNMFLDENELQIYKKNMENWQNYGFNLWDNVIDIQTYPTEEFIETALNLIEKYPTSYRAYELLGAKYFIKGNNEEAIKYYEKAIELAPYLAEAEDYSNLYHAYKNINIEKPDIIKNGLEVYPDFFMLNYDILEYYKYNLKELYKYKDKMNFSYILTLAVYLEKSENFDKEYELIKYIKEKELEEIKGTNLAKSITKSFWQKLFIRLISLNPLNKPIINNDISLEYEIKALIGLKQYPKAENLIKRIKNKNKNKKELLLIKLYLAEENYTEAEKLLNTANINISRSNRLAFYLYSNEMEEFGKYYKSIKKPSNYETVLYGHYLYQKGEYENAIEILEKHEKNFWYDTKLLKTLSDAYEKIGNKNKAKEYSDKISNLKI